MSNRKIDEFFIRQPVNKENPPNAAGNISHDSSRIHKDPDQPMDIIVPEESQQSHQASMRNKPNTLPSQHSYLRFPHHTRALWTSSKASLYSIATKQNCSVEFILQTIYQNIVECRIMNKQHLIINVLNQFFNDFESPMILDVFVLIASYALEAEFLFPQPILILTKYSSAENVFSSQQIRCMLALMFYCLWPKQEKVFDLPSAYTFTKIFTDETGQNVGLKIEKIKCVLNYFKRQKDIECFSLAFCRISVQKRVQWNEMKVPLCDVELVTDKNSTDDYRDSLMIDFANQFIGGGSLGSGSVQEEIMFIKHVEPLISLLFTEKLEDCECVVIKGSQRFCRTSGFKKNFQFDDDFVENIFPNDLGRNNSFIVAIDAKDYNGRVRYQYTMQEINRELYKAFIGFSAEDSICQVATGRWGCGAFAGDDELKFIIQWLACSASNKRMIYLLWETKSEPNIRTFVDLVKSNFTVSDIYKTLVNLQSPQSVIQEVIKRLTQLSL